MAVGNTDDHIVVKETEQSLEDCSRRSHSSSLPPFDKGLGTRRLLKIGFTISCVWALIVALAGLGMLVLGITSDWPDVTAGDLPGTIPHLAKVFTFIFALITTICTEVLGYIHTVTLRWALASEGNLVYNSNLRLFTTSQFSRTNSWWANWLWACSLILCYGGAVGAVWDASWAEFCNIVAPGAICDYNNDSLFVLDIPSIFIMGTGLTSLCVLTGIGWRAGERSGRIKSWNPHPLNTALVCAHYGFIERTVKKPSSLHDPSSRNHRKPKLEHPSARQLVPFLRHVVRYLFSMSLISFILALIVLVVILVQRRPYIGNFTWVFFPVLGDLQLSISQLTIPYRKGYQDKATYWAAIIWNIFWQAFPSLTFHIAEIVVNLHRDETCWRRMSSPKGAKLIENALLAAFSNKGSIALLILKPLGQWMFSLGIFTMGFNPLPLFVLSVLLGVLASLTFIVAHHRPKGPLPATYGHLQSIIDLVDDWGNGAEGRLWWRDKGYITDPMNGKTIRYMGTSGNKKDISEIRTSEDYLTICTLEPYQHRHTLHQVLSAVWIRYAGYY